MGAGKGVSTISKIRKLWLPGADLRPLLWGYLSSNGAFSFIREGGIYAVLISKRAQLNVYRNARRPTTADMDLHGWVLLGSWPVLRLALTPKIDNVDA